MRALLLIIAYFLAPNGTWARIPHLLPRPQIVVEAPPLSLNERKEKGGRKKEEGERRKEKGGRREERGAEKFLLGRRVSLEDPTDCWLLRHVLEENGCEVRGRRKEKGGRREERGEKREGGRIVVRMVERIDGSYDYQLVGYENEAYKLDVSEDLITIESVTPTGVIRAAQTLQQLAEGYVGRSAIEAVSITDWPAFKLRGFMHDKGRSFIPIDDLKRQIRLLSRFKINTFHWHLTENQAWRLR